VPQIVRALAAALVLLALAPGVAQAVPLCPDKPLTRPFLPWLDLAWYELAPNGGFEEGDSSWNLAGGAAVVDGGHPYGGGNHSLALAPGATATTAPACLTAAHPTLRFFGRGSGPLYVSVQFRDPFGAWHELPLGAVPDRATWGPSLPLPVIVNLLGEQEVHFRFAATGAWQIDDLYIDPYSKG
jgi:hypothetical protein